MMGMDQIVVIIAGVVFIIILTWLFLSLDRAETTAEKETFSGRVVVMDGDTLYFPEWGRLVRLEGIDAPEPRQFCRGVSGKFYPCGSVATSALKHEVVGRVVSCSANMKDIYGRLVGECFVDGASLNGWMVEQGHAVAYRKYSSKYIFQENAARKARRGVWQGEFVEPWRWRKGERLAG